MHLTGDQIWSILTHTGTFVAGAVSLFFLQIKRYMAFLHDFAQMEEAITKLLPILSYSGRYEDMHKRVEKMEALSSENASKIAALEERWNLLVSKPASRRVSIAPTQDS